MAAPRVKQRTEPNIEFVIFGELTWINIENPTELETDYLAERYPFHPLDLDDVLSRRQRPKTDEYKEYLFLVYHFPVFNKEERVTATSQLSIFIGEKYLITLHSGDLKPLVKLFRECQLEEEALQEYLDHGSGYLLYRITDRLVDYCLPMLNKILENMEDAEDAIFTERETNVVKEISSLRRDVISFRRTIWPMRAVLGGLWNRVKRFTDQDLTPYFGDMIDHIDKIWDTLDEFKEIIEGLSSTYDSMSQHRTNEVVRLLTILGTVLLPLVVVTGFYGMNIGLPGQNDDHAVLYVLGFSAVIIGLMLLFFRRIRII